MIVSGKTARDNAANLKHPDKNRKEADGPTARDQVDDRLSGSSNRLHQKSLRNSLDAGFYTQKN